jgi:hypothetical protein
MDKHTQAHASQPPLAHLSVFSCNLQLLLTIALRANTKVKRRRRSRRGKHEVFPPLERLRLFPAWFGFEYGIGIGIHICLTTVFSHTIQ